MSKLDEIAELLTEEIKGFENSVTRLEGMHRELKTFKVKPDTTEINYILERHNDHQMKVIDEQNELLAQTIWRIKKSTVIPKWTVKLFWALSILMVLVFGYSIFQISQIPKKEQAAYLQGESNAIGHFERFMEENPKAHTLYKEWRMTIGKK